MVKIDNATGTVNKDQLVRITSEQPQKRPAFVTPSEPSPSPGEARKTGTDVQPSGRDPSFVFVDLNKIFKDYPKTKESEARINEAKNAAKQEFDERVARKEPETELKEWRVAREKELQDQASKMRNEIVGEITSAVKQLAGTTANVVVDISGMSLNSVPVFVYTPSAANMSDPVASALKGQQPSPVKPMKNLKFALVNMADVFKRSTKTKAAEVEINAAKNTAKKSYDQLVASYNKELARAESLSGAAKDKQITKVKALERKINDFRVTKEKDLQALALKKRDAIAAEITKAVGAKLVGESSVVVLDSSGMLLNGVPLVIFSRQVPDLSDEIVTAMNAPGTKSSATTTPLASSSDLRLAYVDMDRIFKAMPETGAAEAEINAMKEKAAAELAGATNEARQAKEKELQDVAVKRREGIVAKGTAAVRQLGGSAGYNLIFNSSGNSSYGVSLVISTHELPDLTDEVIARLTSAGR